MSRRHIWTILSVLLLLLAFLPRGSTETALHAWSQIARAEQESPLDWATFSKEGKVPLSLRIKIDPDVLKQFYQGGVKAEAVSLDEGEPITFLVILREKADLRAAARIENKTERKQAVYTALRETAERSQQGVLAVLQAEEAAGHVVQHKTYFIVNALAVTGDLHALLTLAARPEVERIQANRMHSLPPAPKVEPAESDEDDPRWNITKVRADFVWGSFGVTGEGIIVANMDTGVDFQHPALRHKYRGYRPGGAEHNYNWFDVTGTYPIVPGDGHGHGTHTMGTIVGSEPDGSHAIGVAPGATWIAVKIFTDEGETTDAAILEGFQWILAPTDLFGANPDPFKAPDIVNNSWGSENGADTTFLEAVRAWRAAGILPVFSSGNEGPDTGTVGSPGSFPESFAVGATDIDNEIALFSSRGPSPWGEIKPEAVAPGVDIYSSVPGGGYEQGWSGTSMAAPHVAGLAALLWHADRKYNQPLGTQKNPTLTITDTEIIIMQTALDLGASGPDNDYGWGLVDAYQAVRTVIPHGTFLGRVTDRASDKPVAGARIAMVSLEHGGTTKIFSDAQGYYALDVAAGTYDVTVSHPYYISQMASKVDIIRDTATQLDFALRPLPAGQIRGYVIDAQTFLPISATVEALEIGASVQTDINGFYALSLPVGRYTIRVLANVAGYRGARADRVSIVEGGTVIMDFALGQAPRILLVNADVWRQEKAGGYYGRALEANLYTYDVHNISSYPDGNPTIQELLQYDLVIWSQPKRSPGYIGAWEALAAYLDAGGRLLISGQDIGYWDVERGYGPAYYTTYLHANYIRDDVNVNQILGTAEGALVGLTLTLNPRDSAQNQVWPSEIEPADDLAIPIASYVGDGYAGVQVDNCTTRLVYLAFGLEGLGEAERVVTLDRLLAWLSAARPEYGFMLVPIEQAEANVIGAVVAYEIAIINTGQLTDTYNLSLRGNHWPTAVLDSTGSRSIHAVQVPPCDSATVKIEVTIPVTASIGATDTAIFLARSIADPAAQMEATISTAAFPAWREEAPLPVPRSRLGAASIGQLIYVIGGESAGGIVGDVHIYDPTTNTWREGASKPTPASNLAVAAIGDKIYAPGGYDGDDLRVLEVYDTTTNSWSSAAGLPVGRSGAAVAAVGGKLYLFGGMEGDDIVDTTLEYDPATDTWRARADMPHARTHAAAAVMDGEIYVVGGWAEEDLPYVEVYDPDTDTWAIKASMNVPRMGPGAVGLDGYVYVVGGGLTAFHPSVERYDPRADRWQVLTSMAHGRRTLGVAAACGRIYAISGWDGHFVYHTESLPIGSSLTNSVLQVSDVQAQPGALLIYQVVLMNPGNQALPAASWSSEIPVGTSYVPGSAEGGASYDPIADTVSWSGTVLARETKSFRFQVRLGADLVEGDTIIAVAVIADGVCGPYVREATTRVALPDLALSHKTLSPALVSSGQVISCVITLTNSSLVNAPDVRLVDPLPPHLAYVEGSASGGATYNPARNRIEWSGLISKGVVADTSYHWTDSDAGGVSFEWIDATGGTNIPGGDDASHGPFPIGFPFVFYGQSYDQFFVNTNGQVLFGEGSRQYRNGPIPDPEEPNNFIAAFWDDLVCWTATIYYQTFGTAPHRYTVIEWHNAGRYGGSASYTFQVILYEESNAIHLQYLTMSGERAFGEAATVGIEDTAGTRGIQYLYDGLPNVNQIHDGLAIRFAPPTPFTPGRRVITFQAHVEEIMPLNSIITNTAVLTDSLGHALVLTATARANATDLGPSAKVVDKGWAEVGDRLAYSITLCNIGNMTTLAAWTDTLPAGLEYVTGTLIGPGDPVYDPVQRRITWQGEVAPQAGAGHTSPLTFRFEALVGNGYVSGDVVTNTVEIADVTAGRAYQRQARTMIQSPDLSASAKKVSAETAVSGDVLTYTIMLTNSAPVLASHVRVWDPLPAQVTYIPGSATGGATYDVDQNAISWTGQVPPAIGPASPGNHAISFRARIVEALPVNTAIVNRATIAQNEVITYTRAVTTHANQVDLSLSSKEAWPKVVASLDLFTYTITLLNVGTHPAVNVKVLDPMPSNIFYEPGTATGGATFSTRYNRIEWRGTVPGMQPSEQGGWEDSDGGGVSFAWIDATDGNEIPGGDDWSRGPYPLGFPFQFFGRTYTEFFVNTNGQILFDEESSNFSNRTIPTESTPNNFVAAFWDDLVCPDTGGLFYKTIGSAPNRRMVIEWHNVRRYSGTSSLTFEIILCEGSNDIVVQYLSLSGSNSDGSSATVGIENADGSDGYLYLFDGDPIDNLLHDGLAVRFRQAGRAEPGKHVVTFRVRVGRYLPANGQVVNTASINDGVGNILERSVAVAVNTTDLSASDKVVDQPVAAAGDVVRYTITLRNSGTGTASDVTVSDPIPSHTAFVPGSITGGAIYDAAHDRITWSGQVPSNGSVPISFAVRTDPLAADRTVITNTAWITDGNRVSAGVLGTYTRTAQTTLRAPDLFASEKQVDVAWAHPGQDVNYTIRIRNTSEVTATVRMTDVLPAGLAYVPDSLWASSGVAAHESGVVTWRGPILARGMVLVRFAARVDPALSAGVQIVNVADLSAGRGTPVRRAAAFLVRKLLQPVAHLPLIFK